MIDRINLFFSLNSSMKSDWAVLEKKKEKKITDLIHYAYNNTLFYKDWFDSHRINPHDIKNISDFSLIPPIKREHIQNHFESFISEKASLDRCLIRTTSGSTGTVIKVAWDRMNFWTRVLLFYRAFTMIGYTPFKKITYFLPVTEDTGWNFGLFRNLPVSTATGLKDAAEQIKSFRPHIISVYPSYALDLAEYLSSELTGSYTPEAISLNSEMVYPHDEKRIKELYGCEVYQEYSTVETGMIAAMCKKRNMHIFSDNIHLEILDDDNRPLPPGQTGNVVITPLNNPAMPLIRYSIGDLASIESHECSCGLPFPVLGKIHGRKDDSLQLSNGGRISPWKIYEIIERPLDNLMDDKIALNDFYLIQKRKSEASLYYTKGPDFSDEYIKNLEFKWNNLIGNECSLQIIEQETIRKEKNAKRKYIHSLIQT